MTVPPCDGVESVCQWKERCQENKQAANVVGARFYKLGFWDLSLLAGVLGRLAGMAWHQDDVAEQ